EKFQFLDSGGADAEVGFGEGRVLGSGGGEPGGGEAVAVVLADGEQLAVGKKFQAPLNEGGNAGSREFSVKGGISRSVGLIAGDVDHVVARAGEAVACQHDAILGIDGKGTDLGVRGEWDVEVEIRISVRIEEKNPGGDG